MKTFPLYLNGDFIATEEAQPVVNPAKGEAFARMSVVNRDRVAVALKDAHEAFQTWRSVTAKSRGDFLFRVADAVEHRRAEIARTITIECGKPLSQSLGEVAMAVAHLRWFAEESRRVYGRVMPPVVNGKRHMTIKAPVGVVAAISPWNFPFMLPVRKVAAALAAGCTVVLKPSSLAPTSAVALAECIHAAKPMPDIFQLVMAPATDAALEFVENPICRKISFTGSTATARRLIGFAARQVKPLLLQLSGQAPAIVFNDADLYTAVDNLMMAKFRNAGQSCMSPNRIYVQREVYERFLEALVARVRELKVGDGLEDKVDVGPLINQAAIERAEEHVQDATMGGAKVL